MVPLMFSIEGALSILAELAHGNVRVVGDPNDRHGHPPAAVDHREYGDQQVEQSGWVLYQSWGIADVDKPKEKECESSYDRYVSLYVNCIIGITGT